MATDDRVTFFFTILDQFDVWFATWKMRDYLGCDYKIGHGSFYGGHHGDFVTDDYLIYVMLNPHNVVDRVEYHRPECPNAFMIASCMTTREGFKIVEGLLADKPDIRLLPLFTDDLPDNDFKLFESPSKDRIFESREPG